VSPYYFGDFLAIESLVRWIRPVPMRYITVLLPRQQRWHFCNTARGVTFV